MRRKDRDSRIKALDSIMSHYAGRKTFSYDERVFDNTTILKLDISGMTAKRNV